MTEDKKKLLEVRERFGKYKVEVEMPKELGIEIDLPDTGRTLEANVAVRCRMYEVRLKSLRVEKQREENTEEQSNEATALRNDDYIIMAEERGLSIDALGREPGALMRRWRDGVTVMRDEEIVEYCLERMQAIPPEARGAEWRCVVGLLFPPPAKQEESTPANTKVTAGRQMETDKGQMEQITRGEEGEVEYVDGRMRGVMLTEPRGEMVMGAPLDHVFYIPEWEMTLKEVKGLLDKEREKHVTFWEMAMEKALERVLEWSTNVSGAKSSGGG